MESNPLVPATYDVVMTLVPLVILGIMVVALVSVSRMSKHLTLSQLGVWMLLVIFVPVIGPIVWLTTGRRKALAQPATEPPR